MINYLIITLVYHQLGLLKVEVLTTIIDHFTSGNKALDAEEEMMYEKFLSMI
nr:hypothetical protein [Wolbachia pipientis]